MPIDAQSTSRATLGGYAICRPAGQDGRLTASSSAKSQGNQRSFPGASLSRGTGLPESRDAGSLPRADFGLDGKHALFAVRRSPWLDAPSQFSPF